MTDAPRMGRMGYSQSGSGGSRGRRVDAPREGRMGYSIRNDLYGLVNDMDAPREGRMGYSVMVVSMVPATALMRPARGAWVKVLNLELW